jgi:hypothetical protein
VDLQASVLLLDVSGFTRLSQLYGSRGTAGCESFSRLIATLFHKLSVRAYSLPWVALITISQFS